MIHSCLFSGFNAMYLFIIQKTKQSNLGVMWSLITTTGVSNCFKRTVFVGPSEYASPFQGTTMLSLKVIPRGISHHIKKFGK
jgi:hypothetical protein